GEAVEQLLARLGAVDRDARMAGNDGRREPVEHDLRVARLASDGADDPVQRRIERAPLRLRVRRDREPEDLLEEPPEAADRAEAVRLGARGLDGTGPVDAD